MWANDWMSVFGDGLRQSRNEGVILTRAVWAGAARLGVVLWSSDIWSTFEELTAQVPIQSDWNSHWFLERHHMIIGK